MKKTYLVTIKSSNELGLNPSTKCSFNWASDMNSISGKTLKMKMNRDLVLGDNVYQSVESNIPNWYFCPSWLSKVEEI